MKAKLLILVIMSGLSFTGCGAAVSPYALASAGRIGCPAEYIAVSHIQDGDGAPQAWVACCGQTHYACSSNGDPRRPHTRIICSEVGRTRALSWAR